MLICEVLGRLLTVLKDDCGYYRDIIYLYISVNNFVGHRFFYIYVSSLPFPLSQNISNEIVVVAPKKRCIVDCLCVTLLGD